MGQGLISHEKATTARPSILKTLTSILVVSQHLLYRKWVIFAPICLIICLITYLWYDRCCDTTSLDVNRIAYHFYEFNSLSAFNLREKFKARRVKKFHEKYGEYQLGVSRIYTIPAFTFPDTTQALRKHTHFLNLSIAMYQELQFSSWLTFIITAQSLSFSIHI